MPELKQVILVRKDLKLSKGKMAAQASHASVEAVLQSNKSDITEWRSQGMKKSVLAVADKTELLKFKQLAKDASLVVALITDAGRTHLEPGTMTCLAIGPALEKKIDAVTGELHLIS
ncbi:MAG: peptidyl-tRNA hydrolase Pth2 [Candidatus Woesearchaeota archaeon]|nr:peptidyl-tRNA hydrolase Pth2 [Candidatus Woesearchaeota archaeon]